MFLHDTRLWFPDYWPRGYKSLAHSQTQNKAQLLAACGHVALYFEFETVLKFYNLKASSGSNLFETLMVYLKEFFEKVDFEKQTTDNKI